MGDSEQPERSHGESMAVERLTHSTVECDRAFEVDFHAVARGKKPSEVHLGACVVLFTKMEIGSTILKLVGCHTPNNENKEDNRKALSNRIGTFAAARWRKWIAWVMSRSVC